MEQRRPAGISVLSLALGVLGGATLLAYLVGVVRVSELSEIPWVLFTLGLFYGVLAIAAARTLWQLSPLAPTLFLLWCGSACVYVLVLSNDVPEMRDPLLIPAFLTGLLLFYLGYRYTRRACAPAA
jgi:hypothetical protein